MSNKSNVVVSPRGELSNAETEIKKFTRQFMKANNKVAELIEEQTAHEKELKELSDRKKKLTEKVNEEIKTLKLKQKQLRDRVLFELGERSAHMKLLKELGASVEDKETAKRIPQNLKIEV